MTRNDMERAIASLHNDCDAEYYAYYGNVVKIMACSRIIYDNRQRLTDKFCLSGKNPSYPNKIYIIIDGEWIRDKAYKIIRRWLKKDYALQVTAMEVRSAFYNCVEYFRFFNDEQALGLMVMDKLTR